MGRTALALPLPLLLPLRWSWPCGRDEANLHACHSACLPCGASHPTPPHPPGSVPLATAPSQCARTPGWPKPCWPPCGAACASWAASCCPCDVMLGCSKGCGSSGGLPRHTLPLNFVCAFLPPHLLALTVLLAQQLYQYTGIFAAAAFPTHILTLYPLLCCKVHDVSSPLKDAVGTLPVAAHAGDCPVA